MRNGKDEMEVTDRKQFRLLGLDPFMSGRGTTLGTMSVPARVEKGAFKATGIALLEMTAQSFSPAHFDGMHDFAVSGRQRITAPVVVSVEVEHVGDLPSGSVLRRRPLGRGRHGLDAVRFGRERQEVELFGMGRNVLLADLQIEHRGGNGVVTEQGLDRAQIDTRFQ